MPSANAHRQTQFLCRRGSGLRQIDENRSIRRSVLVRRHREVRSFSRGHGWNENCPCPLRRLQMGVGEPNHWQSIRLGGCHCCAGNRPKSRYRQLPCRPLARRYGQVRHRSAQSNQMLRSLAANERRKRCLDQRITIFNARDSVGSFPKIRKRANRIRQSIIGNRIKTAESPFESHAPGRKIKLARFPTGITPSCRLAVPPFLIRPPCWIGHSAARKGEAQHAFNLFKTGIPRINVQRIEMACQRFILAHIHFLSAFSD